MRRGGEGGGNRGGVTETQTEKRRWTNEEQRPNEFREENEVFPKSSLNLVRWNVGAAVVFDSSGRDRPQLRERGVIPYSFILPALSLSLSPPSLSLSAGSLLIPLSTSLHWFLN